MVLVHVYRILYVRFFFNSELTIIILIVVEPFISNSDRNISDVTMEMYVMTKQLLTKKSREFEAYVFIKKEQSLQKVNKSGKI